MRKPNIKRRTPRHPAVVDLLGGAPTSSAAMPSTLTASAAPGPAASPRGERGRRRPGRTAAVAVAAAAVVAAGAITVGQLTADHSAAEPAASAEAADPAFGPVDDNGLPVLNLPDETETAAPADSETTDECRADRGDQRSGAGVIAAFNYAYYNRRDGAAARALATPTSTVTPAPELQTFIDKLPQGTNYCLRTVELSEGVFLVDLSVMRPGVPVERGTQTVTTAKIDGLWYVDVFK
ncbi:hypothetical protein SAMN02745947_05299 [Rhodococcus rhodochrous J3]|uniref:DUF8176 domain-containing protein n=1 Tax=Rhodococcus rhodochrous J3 TaxID=903528 RepID=A0ABY1MIM6_RHORH|nr:hypothetical protein [Rhodococcus rhodochrous]MBF4476714.1 hypothetical protein [Rhodococcus rhodochrous]SMG58750.1 hypothetical protein SAMN02745947_05299 [Rhodococcus rhodochrous J3]